MKRLPSSLGPKRGKCVPQKKVADSCLIALYHFFPQRLLKGQRRCWNCHYQYQSICLKLMFLLWLQDPCCLAKKGSVLLAQVLNHSRPRKLRCHSSPGVTAVLGSLESANPPHPVHEIVTWLDVDVNVLHKQTHLLWDVLTLVSNSVFFKIAKRVDLHRLTSSN